MFQILFANILTVLSVSFCTNFAGGHCISFFVFLVRISFYGSYELCLCRSACLNAHSSEVCLHDQSYCQIAHAYIAIIVDRFFATYCSKSKFHNASVQSDQRLCCSTVRYLSLLFFIDKKNCFANNADSDQTGSLRRLI